MSKLDTASQAKAAAGKVSEMSGQQMHDLADRLFPICRSITGDGFRETLDVIGGGCPRP